MERQPKDIKTTMAELSQKVDIATSAVALGGSALGIIPIGLTITLLGFNLITYYIADRIKKSKPSSHQVAMGTA